MKQTTRHVLSILLVSLSVLNVIPAAYAYTGYLNWYQKWWYGEAVWLYHDQSSWDWSQLGVSGGINHEDLIVFCLWIAGYDLTQFLMDMGYSNPYPPY